MPLPVDYKIDKIIKEIQIEIKKEMNVDVTYNTILNIVSSQVSGTVKGMEEGHTIVWKYFGSFVATQRRVDMLNRTYIKKGKTPTIIDTGFERVSLSRDGKKIIAESTFSKTGNDDLIPKYND